MNGGSDPQRTSKANRAALLRAVVAAYIAYLGYKIMQAEDTTMSPVTAHIIGIAFIAAAAAFGVYICLRRKKDIEEIKDTVSSEDTGDEENRTDDEA
ncbi:MAG: hypothetical protein IKR73_05530 [Oscillospiraceae bacterium]|nr:hypothetical protein [Oscillospiraceae bacterium]